MTGESGARSTAVGDKARKAVGSGQMVGSTKCHVKEILLNFKGRRLQSRGVAFLRLRRTRGTGAGRSRARWGRSVGSHCHPDSPEHSLTSEVGRGSRHSRACLRPQQISGN